MSDCASTASTRRARAADGAISSLRSKRKAGSTDAALTDGPAAKHFLTPDCLILAGIAIAAALVTLWDLSDGYPSLFSFMSIIVLWSLASVVWLGMVISGIRGPDHSTARDLVAWSLVPVLFLVVTVLSSGPTLDLRFRLGVSEFDALADRIVAGEAIADDVSAGTFDIQYVDYHESYGGEVRLSIGSVGIFDDLMLVRDGGPGGCTERRPLDDRWVLCYLVW